MTRTVSVLGRDELTPDDAQAAKAAIDKIAKARMRVLQSGENPHWLRQ
jgi:hypothetical protein